MLTALKLPANAEPVPRPPLPERLRAGTRALHDRIERNRWFGRLTASDLSRSEYLLVLARVYGHHRPAEEALARALPMLPPEVEADRRLRRTALLEADLLALGFDAVAIGSLPRWQAPDFASAEEAIGMLYVLEGSTMGGQVIARHLAGLLGLGPGNGAGHLLPYGLEVGARWRSFRDALTELDASGRIDGERVVEAACEAFSSLDAWVAATA